MLFVKKSIFIKSLNCVKQFLLFTIISFLISSSVSAQSKDKSAPKIPTRKALYGQASFYANKFNGRKTASGEIFSQTKFTCACNVLPIGTRIKVTNLRNNRWVIVKVNDRMHPKVKRVVDLSKAAAIKLGFVAAGLTKVKVEVLTKGEN